MTKLLYMIASPRGEQSESTALGETFLAAYREHRPGLEVDTLNLWEEQLPIFSGNGAAAKMTVFGGPRSSQSTRPARRLANRHRNGAGAPACPVDHPPAHDIR